MISRVNPERVLTGRDYNRIVEEFHSNRIQESPTVRPSYFGTGVALEAKAPQKVSINPWHPFLIYKSPTGGPNGWRTFRVRSGRVGVVFPPSVVDSDGVVDPYSSEQPVTAAEFLMPGYIGRFWFWLEIGDGTANIRAQRSSALDPLVGPVVALPTEVNVNGDFVNIHPKYRPIGYFEVLDPNTQSTRIVQNLVADLVGPMVNLCSADGQAIGYAVPIS